MKIFISADIEGIAGITDVKECRKEEADYAYFQNQMTLEVAAACEGASAAGATEILVKDAHGSGRNIDPSRLPRHARVVRGWSGHPQMMMDRLDSSFAAAICIGYHSRAGSGANPLAHTISGRAQEIRINGTPTSEFLINSSTAAMHGVPVVFLSGDEDLCRESKARLPQLVTVAPLCGHGSASIGLHPGLACEQIRDGVRAALDGDLKARHLPNPASFTIEIEFRAAHEAYGRSFYPGAELVNERLLRFETRDWLDALRLFRFVL